MLAYVAFQLKSLENSYSHIPTIKNTIQYPQWLLLYMCDFLFTQENETPDAKSNLARK